MKHSSLGRILVTAGLLLGVWSVCGRAMAAETAGDVAVRQAEQRFDAALQAADAKLQEAQAEYRRNVAAARAQLLADLEAARTAIDRPAASGSSTNGPDPADEFANMPVSVPAGTPAKLFGGESIWTEVPAIARGAVIYVPPNDARFDGVVEFSILRDALVGLAASWAYDGNSGGGWQAERMSKEQLAADGWIEVGTMYRGLADRHTIFFRQCRKGESFRIRTRKYREPYVLVPGVVEVPEEPEAAPPDPKLIVEVPGSEVHLADDVIAPNEMPGELEGLQLFDSGTSGVTIVRVHKPGPLYVAASWQNDGNASGQWMEERWLKEDFQQHGWKELGNVNIPHRGHAQPHTYFVRECKPGERFRLRTRKYGAPFIFAPQPEVD